MHSVTQAKVLTHCVWLSHWGVDGWLAGQCLQIVVFLITERDTVCLSCPLQVSLLSFNVESEHTFLDYIKGGWVGTLSACFVIILYLCQSLPQNVWSKRARKWCRLAPAPHCVLQNTFKLHPFSASVDSCLVEGSVWSRGWLVPYRRSWVWAQVVFVSRVFFYSLSFLQVLWFSA